MAGKLIIFSAPSGAGKSTLVHYLLTCGLNLEFSVSATSRALRGKEKDGVDYYFITPDKFRELIDNKELLEYEEVYSDCYYGTLRSEVKRITERGKNVIFDVDVKGGINIKKEFGDKALAIFVAPPSVQTLAERLENRATDSEEMIRKRVEKAEYEMSFVHQFDKIVVNDNLETAKKEVLNLVSAFLND
jgi:guanylate kinase